MEGKTRVDQAAADKALIRDEISAGMDEALRMISAAHRRVLHYIAEWDRRELWKQDGAPNMVHWVSARFGLSHYEARLRVDAAHTLDDLPLISAALESGALSLAKVVQLARFASAETERELIKWARRVQPNTIKDKADVWRKLALEEVKEAQRSRRLDWWWSPTGDVLHVYGQLPAAEGAIFAQGLKRLADTLPDVLEDEDSEHKPSSQELFERRCADALVALVRNEMSLDKDQDRATVVLHSTLDSLGHNSEIENGPVIHPDVASRLSCDCRLQFVLTDKQGNALGIGRTSRNIPLWLMRQLRYRDRHCTFPGCDRKRHAEGHHIRHWEQGGPTELDNLILLCFYHHRLVHEFGWSVKLVGSEVNWYRPGGKRYEPGPDPPRRLPIETTEEFEVYFPDEFDAPDWFTEIPERV